MLHLFSYRVSFLHEGNVFTANVKANNSDDALKLAYEVCNQNTNWDLSASNSKHNKVRLISYSDNEFIAENEKEIKERPEKPIEEWSREELMNYIDRLEYNLGYVYCDITGRRMSYPNYNVGLVLSEMEQVISDRIEQGIRDELEDKERDVA